VTKIFAPAKLTLSLVITGVRSDGFHLIEAEMVSLDIADEIEITASDTTTITVSGPFASGVPTDSTNLVARALLLAGRNANVHIQKNIPNGGGLGGGSTDAAAVLRWADWDDARGAAVVGADIPFCLVGGRALVTGIGEIVTPLPHIDKDFTLFLPPISASTPAVYREWDAMGGPKGPNGNDLEPAAISAFPELGQWRDRVQTAIGSTLRLAGSGSTWFTDGHVHQGLDQISDVQVVYTTTRP
jgi:4-diphosphocytidyl-2-C-methyl-D-erythritol kinase